MSDPTLGQPARDAGKKKGIPLWLVVGGILVACAAILGIVVVVAVVWWSSHGDSLRREAMVSRQRGADFGRTHVQDECVGDVLSRLDTSGFLRQVQDRLYLDACLEVALPSEGFCQGVPPESKILSSVAWRLKTCAHHGMADNQDCANMMSQVQRFCNPKPRESASGE